MKDVATPADKFYLEKRMRTFVYLSTTKLRPLYDHIKEPIRKRIALALGIGLPALPVAPKIEAEVRPPTTTEIDMLAVVLSHLDEAGDIGTVDEPRGYFAGQLTLRWAATDEFLFLSGSTEQTLVALTGSNRHIVGDFEVPGRVSLPGSSRVGALRSLDKILAEAEDETGADVDVVARLAVKGRRRRQESFEFVARRLALEDTFITRHDYRPSPDFEHLIDRRIRVVHGTPLYLAYTD